MTQSLRALAASGLRASGFAGLGIKSLDIRSGQVQLLMHHSAPAILYNGAWLCHKRTSREHRSCTRQLTTSSSFAALTPMLLQSLGNASDNR